MKHNGKGKKRLIKYIVTLSIIIGVLLSLIITNIFVPVKYLASYINFKTDVNGPGVMRVRFLDVGYGDCTVVELPDGKTMVIDGGKGTYADVNGLLKVLNKSKIDKIDYLICTSVKSEHCGGLAELIKYKQVLNVYVPYVTDIFITDEFASFYNRLLKSGVKFNISEYGEGVYNPEYDYWFGILSPSVRSLAGSEYDEMNSRPTKDTINDASCVLWLQYAGNGILFLGDVGGVVQSKVVRTMRMEDKTFILGDNVLKFGKCAAVKTSNHCGPDSVCAPLYDFIAPSAAIITVGDNAQSSPSIEDIAILQLYVGDEIYRTDIHGTITINMDSANYHIAKETT